MTDIMPIKHTLEVICSCWNEAETLLQQNIKDLYPNSSEPFITDLFHGLLKKTLHSASQKKLIENAFIQDLNEKFPLIDYSASRQCANGLIAELKKHSQTTEAKTGGDLGFVIARPHIFLDSPYSTETNLIITKDYKRGILTQAKLKDDKEKWNNFTALQENILPQHLDFLALLLYSYNDKNRYILEQFRWQLAAGYLFNDLKTWIKKDEFPNVLSSCSIINNLGNAKIGTDDPQKIRDIICPPENQTVTIDIHWPGGDPPISRVWLRTRQEEKHAVQQVITW